MRRHIVHFTHRHVRHYIHRHEAKGHTLAHVKSGVGAILAITFVGLMAVHTGLPMLIAPFGATAVLLFGQPRSPLAQPANIVGGYLVASVVASAATWMFPGSWEAAAAAVGISIAAMAMLRLTHPPAGAIPLVAFASRFDLPMLVVVVLAGSALMIAIGVLHHLIPPRQQYPMRAN